MSKIHDERNESSSYLMNTIAGQAIKAAMNQDWEHAIHLNTTLVEKDPNNIDTLNRLGNAYIEIGKYTLALETYKKVLTLDKYNAIAQRNIQRISFLRRHKKTRKNTKEALRNQTSKAAVFLEEPGKTRVVPAVRLADPHILLQVSPSDPVLLVRKSRRLSVILDDGTYLGALPDDVSSLLLLLMKGGNTYESFVKEVRQNSLQIFIRETHRSKQFGNQPSFVSNIPQHYVSFMRGTPQVTESDDEDEGVERNASTEDDQLE